jgi:hypothetical protein
MESPNRRFKPKTRRKSARKRWAMGEVVAGFVQIRCMSTSTTRMRSNKPKPPLG